MKIIIKNQISEIRKVNDLVEEISKPWNLPMNIEAQLNLVFDELLSNIIKYAFKDNAKHNIEINFEKKDQKIYIEVVDDGVEFNPLDYPEPKLNPDLSERDIGGLGIHIVKKLTHEYFYNRDNGHNSQVLVKYLN